MKKYNVSIKGVTPYMQHRMDDQKLSDWEVNRKLIIDRTDVCQEDSIKAEYHCYRNSDGKCYIPSDHIRGAMINAGSLSKSKVGNSRKSMKNIVAGMFFVEPEQIIIPDYDNIDKRSAVNRNIKARIIVVRPKWNQWHINFNLLVDNDTITTDTIKEIIINSGQSIGIGSFRPMNNGMFGRYELDSFKEII